MHAESTGVTRVFEIRPVLEGSGRDADPCQRQQLGPSDITKMIALQLTGGEQRLQPVFCIVCQALIALCRSIRRRVIGSDGRSESSLKGAHKTTRAVIAAKSFH